MSKQPPTLESQPSEVLQRIAYHVAADTLLGPLNSIVPLLLTSRTIYNTLPFANNTHLHAKLFRYKFDTSASERRLSGRRQTTKCLSAEFKKRLLTLKRIRRRQMHLGYVEDLWTAYIMMTENDGRNEAQLIDYAGIQEYLYDLLELRLNAPRYSPFYWYADWEGTALLAWLLYLTVDRASVKRESPQLQADIKRFLDPFIVAGRDFPFIYAPESHFYLPLCEPDEVAPHASGPDPASRTIMHYGLPLRIAAPSLCNAAILAVIMRTETRLDDTPPPEGIDSLPPTRTVAIACGLSGPTREDVLEFHYETRMRLNERQPVVDIVGYDDGEDEEEEDDDVVKGSMRFDHDWYRLVSCHDLRMADTPLRGPLFSPGSLVADWMGRNIIPDLEDYVRMFENPGMSPSHVATTLRPLAIRIREHHCFAPFEPVDANETEDGDGILDAWLPEGMRIQHEDEFIQFVDPITGETTRYETYFPDRPGHYSRDVCERLRGQEEFSHVVTEDGDTSSDEWEDETEQVSSGVRDIILTATTVERSGQAWGHFGYVGRVRPWDGLVVLRCIMTHPDHGDSPWIFRGYLYGDNLVGRWRGSGGEGDTFGYQGGFVLRRTAERV